MFEESLSCAFDILLHCLFLILCLPLYNPTQYPSGLPHPGAGPSNQQNSIGHRRMFGGDTFGGLESSGSGESYHTALEFQPMHLDSSSSGGSNGYGHN